jgi:hypothetical protein
MAFFKSHEKTLAQNIEAARANRDRLATRRNECELAVIDAKTRAQSCALSGNDAAQDAAEIDEGAAQRRLNTVIAALTEATALLTKLETEYAALVDKKVRTATAAEVAELASDLEANSLALRAMLDKSTALTKRAAMFIPEAIGVNAFSDSSSQQIGPAIELVTMLMRNYAAAVLDGSAPAILPTPEKPFTPTIAPKPATRRLFTLRSVCRTNADGMLRVAQKFTDVDLPLDAADRAIAARVCVEVTDPARKSNRHQWPGHPDPTQCFSVDEPSTMASAAPDEPVQFEPLDRGKPYVVRAAVGGVV